MSDFRDTLEDKLLEAVERRNLTTDVNNRGTDGQHRPRAHRIVALSAVAVLAGAAVMVVLIGLGGEAPRAFAGWSPRPTAAPNGRVAHVAEACRTRLAGRVEQLRREARQPGLGELARAPLPARSGWRTVVADTRGPYTMIVLEQGNGHATSTCFAGRHGEVSNGWGVRKEGAPPPRPVAPEHVAYEGSGGTTTPPAEGSRLISYVYGRAGTGVQHVTIRLNNGRRVYATTTHGWFVAWWPGSHGIRATEVTTAGGTRRE